MSMIGASSWLAWAVLVPVMGGLLALFVGRGVRLIAALVSVTTVFIAALVAWQVAVADEVLRHLPGGWGASLGIELRADGLAALMLVVVGVVSAFIGIFAMNDFQPGSRPAGFLPSSFRAFFPLWMFAWAALNGLILSKDIFNLYVTLELLMLAAVALIALAGKPPALSASLRYLLLALVGSMAYLTGVALLYAEYTTLDIDVLGIRVQPDPATGVALALMTLGLCLKSSLFPLHGWLPQVYGTAAPPVSALLAALVGKGAFYVILRLWVDVFAAVIPLGATWLIGVLGGAGVLWGSYLALRQERLALLAAYSSVAHIGYLFLIFPLGTPDARAGGVYLLVSHAVAKASMFMAIGVVQRTTGADTISRLQGLASRLPVTFFALGLAGMSLMGVPPSGGFIAKWLLVRAAITGGQWWHVTVVVIVLGGGLLSAGYVLRMLYNAFRSLPMDAPVGPVPRVAELVTLALALVAFGLGVYPDPLLRLMRVGGFL